MASVQRRRLMRMQSAWIAWCGEVDIACSPGGKR
jgi:hypothetical protein